MHAYNIKNVEDYTVRGKGKGGKDGEDGFVDGMYIGGGDFK